MPAYPDCPGKEAIKCSSNSSGSGSNNSSSCVFGTGFVATFSVVTVFGCLLNYLLFLCTTYNSALTTSVTGTLKTIIQTVIGMFTFGGISINVFTILGLIHSTRYGFHNPRYQCMTACISLFPPSISLREEHKP